MPNEKINNTGDELNPLTERIIMAVEVLLGVGSEKLLLQAAKLDRAVPQFVKDLRLHLQTMW